MEVRPHFGYKLKGPALAANPTAREFQLCVLVFNCLHSLAPTRLKTMSASQENHGRRYLHSADSNNLVVLVKSYDPRSFAAAGPSIWNSLLCSSLILSSAENWIVQPLACSRLFNKRKSGRTLTLTTHHGQRQLKKLDNTIRKKRLTWTKKLSDQLNLAHAARKKLKQTNASANLVQYRLKIRGGSLEGRRVTSYGGKDLCKR